tara:strand:- start:1014 stop:1274 length:261 start_codon:yes stop_codon:yes gene_type:complete
MPKLKLDRFRRIYKSLKTPWKPLNWIILGYLMGIEQQYISIRTKQTVDEAINNYKKQVLDEVKKPTVVMKKTDDGWEMSIGEVDKK